MKDRITATRRRWENLAANTGLDEKTYKKAENKIKIALNKLIAGYDELIDGMDTILKPHERR